MAFKVHYFAKRAKTSLRNRTGSCLHGKILGQLGIFVYPSEEEKKKKEKRKETLLNNP